MYVQRADNDEASPSRASRSHYHSLSRIQPPSTSFAMGTSATKFSGNTRDTTPSLALGLLVKAFTLCCCTRQCCKIAVLSQLEASSGSPSAS